MDSKNKPPPATISDPRDPHAPTIPLIDPTANVLKHVEGAIKRLDDLGELNDKWTERLRMLQAECDKETQELREKLAFAESKRIDALTLAESRRLDSVNAETKAAVALASERATTTAAALAASLSATTAAQDQRMSRMEQQFYQFGGRDAGRTEQRTEGRAGGQFNMNIIAAVVGAVGMIIGLIALALAAFVAFAK
jgi:hypothetical protein